MMNRIVRPCWCEVGGIRKTAGDKGREPGEMRLLCQCLISPHSKKKETDQHVTKVLTV